ncbi:MAG: CBS domain-containing protein, partial [Chloroflexota bacterium]
VSQVMLPGYPVVPAGLTVDQLIYQFVLTGGRRFFLVADDDGRVAGVLTLEDIKAVPRPDRVVRRVGEIMTPAAGLPAVSPEQEAATALERLEESGTNELLVVSEGRVVGLVGCDHLLNVLRTRAELAG